MVYKEKFDVVKYTFHSLWNPEDLPLNKYFLRMEYLGGRSESILVVESLARLEGGVGEEQV